MKFYKIAKGATVQELEMKVNEMLDYGFELQGGGFTDVNLNYCQSMVFEDAGDERTSLTAYNDYVEETKPPPRRVTFNLKDIDPTALLP
jgi:hypothetical protein